MATPAGWYHKSCVHEIPNGARVSASGLVKRRDGTTFQIPACSHPGPLNRANFGRSNSATFPTNNGWMEYAYYQLTSGNSFHQLNAGWRVPPAPTGSYGGTDLYYSFPGLENGSYIIQPVIQYGYNGDYGGSYWTAASWRCNDGSDCLHGTPILIGAGDSVAGSVTASACASGTCTWTISTIDVTRGTHSDWTVSDGDNYYWATGGAVEVYGLTSCSQYPNNGIFYSGILLHDQSGTLQSPVWASVTPLNPSPSCSFGVSTTTTRVNLYHNPPAPLSNTIISDAPTYTASPTGGVSPYTYYWEECSFECGALSPALQGSSVVPNEPAHGWQFISSNRTVTWSKRQNYLRNTATDTQGTQALAQIYIP